MTDQQPTARQRLLDALRTGTCFCGADSCTSAEPLVDALLTEHAHQLAEQIRAETAELKAHGVLEPDKFRPCRDAADQIDPEAQR